MTESILSALLVASLAAACLLILFASALLGKKLAERDYQRAAEIDGTLRIQTTVNIRTQAMRVMVGATFAVFAILLLADAPMIWRMWVNRILFVLVPLGYCVASMLDWLAERAQMHLELAEEHARKAAARTAPEGKET